MHRRDVLKSVVSAAAGAGLVAASGDSSQAGVAKTGASTTKPAKTPFIVTRDGASLFYKDWGNGKPVVFVHSWALNSDMWQYQMIHLAGQGLRCVAYDSRGHGRSSDPGQGYDYDTLAGDLAAVIEQLNLREVTLVGHSMGCGEIVRYLSRHGAARIARAALVAPTTPFLLKTEDNPDGVDKRVFEQLRAMWSERLSEVAGRQRTALLHGGDFARDDSVGNEDVPASFTESPHRLQSRRRRDRLPGRAAQNHHADADCSRG